MNPFEELEGVLEIQREEGDFPDWLAAEIGEVLSHPVIISGAE